MKTETLHMRNRYRRYSRYSRYRRYFDADEEGDAPHARFERHVLLVFLGLKRLLVSNFDRAAEKSVGLKLILARDLNSNAQRGSREGSELRIPSVGFASSARLLAIGEASASLTFGSASGSATRGESCSTEVDPSTG